MLTFYITLIALAGMAAAVVLQFKRELMMLQQNSYRNKRFRHWERESKASTSYDRLIGWIVLGISLVPRVSLGAGMALAAVFGIWNAVRLARARYKKPLVFTPRARRIYAVALGIVALVLLSTVGVLRWEMAEALRSIVDLLLLCYICSDLAIMASNWLLKPVEASINKKYYDEAAQMLASMPDLKIIGVTGSYGKTSTKHYLNRILSEQYDVLMTPGNFNTTLGVIRTVREHMKPYNEVFIVEMGAKQRGDIKEICDLVHPQIGIITAVGPMHLETFKSMEGVQATKFELADALPADGFAVVNNDFEYIANRQVRNVECARYSAEDDPNADFKAANIKYTPEGTTFDILDKNGNKVISLKTKLVGRCNVSNLIAAAIVALRLGVKSEKIRYAVEKIEQVEHRLNMKRLPSGITLIDDAYNSNPVGSKMALEVLGGMTQGKRIVITPGMIELGEDQFQLNRELGEAIAKEVDVAIIVGEYNREAIMEGLKEGGMDMANAHAVPTFNDAQAMMLQMATPGDTVLYENDLPDTFK